MNHGSACLRSPCAVTKSLKWAPSLIHKTLKSPWVKLRETLLSRPLRCYASSSVLLGQALWNSKTNEFIKSDANSKRITDNSSSNSRLKRRINRKITSDELSVKLTIIPLSNCFLVSYVRAQLRKKANFHIKRPSITFRRNLRILNIAEMAKTMSASFFYYKEWRNIHYSKNYWHLQCMFPFCNTTPNLFSFRHHIFLCTETLQHDRKVVEDPSEGYYFYA